MNLKTIAFSVLFIGAFTLSGFSQSSKSNSNDQDYKQDYTIRIGDFVKVMMPNGREVVAVVKGKLTNNKYHVRKYKSNFQGEVNKKFIRPMSQEELIAMREKYSTSSSTASRY